MKVSKPTSFTIDTEQSPIQMFQSQLLSKTNISKISQDPNKPIQRFSQPQNKQTIFLKAKNQQLQEKVKRLEQKVFDLQNNKIYLLKINEKYVNVLNRYYSDQKISKKDPLEDKMTVQRQSRSQSERSLKKGQKRTLSCQKHVLQHQEIPIDLRRLEQLQKDHRNLTRHCLVMEHQIKQEMSYSNRNYSKEMQKFTQIKAQLQTVNHTSPKQLINQLQQVVAENKILKKQNNRLSFELQKLKLECNKIKKAKQTQKRQAELNQQELPKLRSQINKVFQESKDKSDKYEQRVTVQQDQIYELELKVSKLENQLRRGQQAEIKIQEKRKSLEISRAGGVTENNNLRNNLSELLDPKKHLLMSTGNIYFKERLRRNNFSIDKKSLSPNKKAPFIL